MNKLFTYFNNLSLKFKLLSAFLLIGIFLIIQGFRSYRTIVNLENNKTEIFQSLAMTDNIATMKFALANDLKVLMEIISADNNEKLEYFWKQHLELVKQYDEASNNLIATVKDETWGEDYSVQKATFNKDAIEFDEFHNSFVQNNINQIHDLKIKLSNISNDSSSNQLKVEYQSNIEKLNGALDTKAEEIFTKMYATDKNIHELGKIIAQKSEKLETISKIETLVLIILGIVFAIIIAFGIANYLVKNILQLKGVINNLSLGVITDNISITSKDEIGDMITDVNKLNSGLKSTSNFAVEIGKGHFDKDFTPLSDKDELGNSLVNMRTSLLEVTQNEAKRNWVTEGMAKFADILRKEQDEFFYDNIVSNLVKYLNANQAGLFVADQKNNKNILVLKSCYAYERKKILEKEIDFGVGLIGQCVLEKETIILTEIPTNYIQITSGLGDATPGFIIIVPLKLNDQVSGVIEIASFKMFEDYKIEFIEKVAESIASTVIAAKINERTKKLLEESQLQTEQMRAQEEEMRQNMEEMAATQEEMERKEIEMHKIVEQMKQQEEEMRQNLEEMQATQEEMARKELAISKMSDEFQAYIKATNASVATIEFTTDGTILKANDNFLHTTGYTIDEIKGKHHSMFVKDDYKNSEEYKTFWTKLASGIPRDGEFERVNKNGKLFYLQATYTPIEDINTGKITKIVKFATDITKYKK